MGVLVQDLLKLIFKDLRNDNVIIIEGKTCKKTQTNI
jgi:hypothetical protein